MISTTDHIRILIEASSAANRLQSPTVLDVGLIILMIILLGAGVQMIAEAKRRGREAAIGLALLLLGLVAGVLPFESALTAPRDQRLLEARAEANCLPILESIDHGGFVLEPGQERDAVVSVCGASGVAYVESSMS